MSIALIRSRHPARTGCRLRGPRGVPALLAASCRATRAPSRSEWSATDGSTDPVAVANASNGTGRSSSSSRRHRSGRRQGRNPPLDAFLDIRSRVSCCGERGLLGIAFHPSYRTNGRFYLSYTDSSGALVVSEFHDSAPTHRTSTTRADHPHPACDLLEPQRRPDRVRARRIPLHRHGRRWRRR